MGRAVREEENRKGGLGLLCREERPLQSPGGKVLCSLLGKLASAVGPCRCIMERSNKVGARECVLPVRPAGAEGGVICILGGIMRDEAIAL